MPRQQQQQEKPAPRRSRRPSTPDADAARAPPPVRAAAAAGGGRRRRRRDLSLRDDDPGSPARRSKSLTCAQFVDVYRKPTDLHDWQGRVQRAHEWYTRFSGMYDLFELDRLASDADVALVPWDIARAVRSIRDAYVRAPTYAADAADELDRLGSGSGRGPPPHFFAPNV